MNETTESFLPDKEYFNIGEASRLTQVPEYTLRYWEDVLHAPRPMRRQSGHRRYTRKDLESIFKIKDLLYGRKLTLAGAKKLLAGEKRTPKDAETADLATLGKLKRELREVLVELSR